MGIDKLPLGFGFSLVQNPEAMKKFSDLSESEQENFINRAHNVSSKDEMQALVSELTKL